MSTERGCFRATVAFALGITAVLYLATPTAARPVRTGGNVPVAIPTPGPADTTGMLGVPTIVDDTNTIVGQSHLTSRDSSKLFIALGEVNGRSIPFSVWVRQGGFQPTGLLYFRTPDCSGPPFLQSSSTGGLGVALESSAVVTGPTTVRSTVSGPGTTAYVPFGDLEPHQFKSRARWFHPVLRRCSDGFRIPPATCCVPISQEQLGVPADPIDLSEFVPPFRLELLEPVFVDR